VDADLDTLATALYARTDELLKSAPERLPWRPAVGIAPRICDAEVVTLAVLQAVLQALLGYTSEARWLRFARAHLRHLFPYLPQQPGYNKRLRGLMGTLSWLTGALARDTSVWTDDVWVVDSTPVECARSRDTVRRSQLAGWAEYGYCASHSRYFWGLRLHAARGGRVLIADKNYDGRDFEAALAGAGIELLRRARQGEPARAGGQFFKPLRQTVESIFDTLKGQLDLERHGGHTPPESSCESCNDYWP